MFRTAIGQALPHARVVADCFYIVQLAQCRLADLRRRLTHKHYGRRARKGDAVYAVRRLLRRNAFGFRNRANQHLRSRCATTRRSRREAHPH